MERYELLLEAAHRKYGEDLMLAGASAVAAYGLPLVGTVLRRVEVVDGAGGVGGPDGADRPELVATLTSSRARWRQARWGTADATLTRLIDLAELGWQTLRNEPDLEAWWGGWG